MNSYPAILQTFVFFETCEAVFAKQLQKNDIHMPGCNRKQTHM